MVEMVAADGKCVAITAENKHMQVRPGKGNARGERQRTSMNVMHAVRLHEIRKPAGAADARDGRDVLVPHFALLNELEVKREHREIAATGTPRRVIGGKLLFRQPLALGTGHRRHGRNIHPHGTFGNHFAHNNFWL